jgi:hypothetical protein
MARRRDGSVGALSGLGRSRSRHGNLVSRRLHIAAASHRAALLRRSDPMEEVVEQPVGEGVVERLAGQQQPVVARGPTAGPHRLGVDGRAQLAGGARGLQTLDPDDRPLSSP